VWVPLTVDEELDELFVPPVFPPCWLKKPLLLCDDEFVELDEFDEFDEPDELDEFDEEDEDPDELCVDWPVVVVPTWCNATSPLNVPKPTIERTANALLNRSARAIACALGIFCGAFGF
jgi:hypothetical protein